MSIAFDQAAGYYDESRGIPREVEEQAADQVEAAVGPDARLLEMGVGTGRVALPLHRRGRQVVGVDLSLPMLERYRAKAAAEGLAPRRCCGPTRPGSRSATPASTPCSRSTCST